jgi:hypothetical protein
VSTVVVRHYLYGPGQTGVPRRRCTVDLTGAGLWLSNETGEIIDSAVEESDDTGLVEFTLTPQSEIAGPDSYYVFRIASTDVARAFIAPVSAVAVKLVDHLVDPDTLDPVDPDLPSLYLARAELGAANGVAPLGADGRVPTANLPVGSGGDLDADLVTIGALTPANDDLLQRKAGAWTNRTPGQVKADLALVPGDLTGFDAAVVALVNAGVAALVDSAPATLDTLNELAAALGDDPNFATTITAALAGKIGLTVVDAAGDLIVGSGADTVTRLAKGGNGQLLGVAAGAVGWVDPPATGLQVDPTAARYGCVALTMHPHDISWISPQFIALVSGRHYMYWVPLPAGTLITGVRLPVQTAGAGAGALRFGLYNDDNTALGDTGDVAAQFTGAVGQTWQSVPLSAPAATTGDGVWITALSTLDTGPAVVFSDTDGTNPLPEWLLNPTTHRTALLRNGVAALPATLVPATANPYIDFAIGVY